MTNSKTHGMLLGKFLPPHRGHCYLADFASNFVDHLSIIVGTLPSEPIPGHLRFSWMQELFPQAQVLHLDKVLPQDPSEHPDFWNIWTRELQAILPNPPDVVFASEPYGHKLAEVLGARFIPVDLARKNVPTSGTAIRNDPYSNWEFIPPVVRSYFLKRVCIFGPESTGKSTLTQNLAEHYKTSCVPEYARCYLEEFGDELDSDAFMDIARGQIAAEKALASSAHSILFCDTDPLLTTVWSQFLIDQVAPQLKEFALEHTYDLYLLTKPDVPWVADSVRYLPDERETFFQACEKALQEANRPYAIISGSWHNRFKQAERAISDLLKKTSISA